MKNLSSKSIIRVYFNDLLIPARMTYAAEIQGKLIALKDESCDANDLADIKELSGGELHECNDESFFLNYYEVENGEMGTPFEDDDIPTRYFELGTLA